MLCFFSVQLFFIDFFLLLLGVGEEEGEEGGVGVFGGLAVFADGGAGFGVEVDAEGLVTVFSTVKDAFAEFLGWGGKRGAGGRIRVVCFVLERSARGGATGLGVFGLSTFALGCELIAALSSSPSFH